VGAASWSSDPPRLLLGPRSRHEGARLLALGWRVEVTEPGPDEVNGFAYLVDTDGFRVEPKPEDGKATIERWLAGGSLYD